MRVIAVLLLAYWLFGCEQSGREMNLYRSSVYVDDDIHITSFNATDNFSSKRERDAYNETNCSIVAGLLQEQPGVEVRYWCKWESL